MTDGFCDFALAVGLFHTQISDLVAESESGAIFVYLNTHVYTYTHTWNSRSTTFNNNITCRSQLCLGFMTVR